MQLKTVFDGIQEKMLIDFQSITSQVEHRGAKGKLREIEIISEYLNQYLPENIGISNGECVSVHGDVSGECDIILYAKNSMPYLVHKEGYRVFPIECVYGVIEIKSKLDNNELEKSFHNIKKIKQMPKIAIEEQSDAIIKETCMYGKSWPYFPVYGTIIAYDSINIPKLKARLEELQADTPHHLRLDSAWVLKKGMIIYRTEQTGTIERFSTPDTAIRSMSSKNPLLLLTIHLQSLMGSAWIGRFRIMKYLEGAEFGNLDA